MLKNLKEYDDKGNLIHQRNCNGFEFWQEFDNNNNMIQYKDSDGLIRQCKYNSDNELITFTYIVKERVS